MPGCQAVWWAVSAVGQNLGYAGWGVAPTTASPVSVSFVVPTLTCPANRNFGTIPGVIAGGRSTCLGAGVALECYGGQPHYSAVSFYNGPFDNLGPVVSPGDSISVSVSDNSTSAKATLTDVTTGDSGTNTYKGFPMSYADMGDDSEFNYYNAARRAVIRLDRVNRRHRGRAEPGDAERHTYSSSGDYTVSVDVVGPGGDGAGNAGVAEIVGSSSAPATDSVGALTWTGLGGKVEECTATALAGLDAVITARHCFDDLSIDSNLEFAPRHTGNCGSGNTIMTISACEVNGTGHDPLGYWTGTGAIAASDSGIVTDAGQDTTLVALRDTSSAGFSPIADVGGLPIHFDPPHGQLTFSAYGYPGRVGVWSLRSCTNEKDLSASSDSVVGISPCDFGFSNGIAGGTSGGPFISSNILPNAISATMWFDCQPGTACTQGGQIIWPHPESGFTAVANLMSNNAMQLYLVEILGVPQP